MSEIIRDMRLDDADVSECWRRFLRNHGISRFDETEVAGLTRTIGLFDEAGRLVGTGSVSGSVIKFVAVDSADAVAGSRFNRVFGELVARLSSQGISHYFVFTKPRYAASFEHVGCKCLARVDVGAVLEGGMPTVKDYLRGIGRPKPGSRVGAVVMHADPFTNGHRHLVEVAARECDRIYVFVVHYGPAMFTFPQRMRMVREGLDDLGNVVVADGGEYMVGFALFPSYFLSGSQNAVDYQTRLDATLFGNWVVPWLSIGDRYVGSEPYSAVTAAYNRALCKVLEPRVSVHVIDRLAVEGSAVSASRVRGLVERGDDEAVASLVPPSTQSFIQQQDPSLRGRANECRKDDSWK